MIRTSKPAGGQGAVRKRLVPTAEAVRSAVSNGSTLIPGLDHRSAWARRAKDLIDDQLACLGPQEAISEYERILVRRSAMLTLQAELIEAEWSADPDGRGSAASLETYQRLVNTTRRTIEVLAQGYARPPRNGEHSRDVTQHARAVLEAVRNADR